MRVAWSGRPEEARAVERLRADGRDVVLALAPDEVVPDFVLEAQAAAFGLAWTRAPAEREERAPLREALAAGWRAVVVAAQERDAVGRFVDDATPPGVRALAVEGPGFARRVDVVAGDVVAWRDGWRLEVGLRGC